HLYTPVGWVEHSEPQQKHETEANLSLSPITLLRFSSINPTYNTLHHARASHLYTPVGWVEHSEPQQSFTECALLGFSSLNPSYNKRSLRKKMVSKHINVISPSRKTSKEHINTY
ncbi:MAG: hypothetical protein ACI9T9_000796, partial [Oleiphilaceae bacterium]